MKLNKFLSATLCVLMGLFALTSCGSDDEPTSTTAAKSIAGTYVGDLSQTVMGANAGDFSDISITVTATSDNEVSITFPEYGPENMIMPAITIKGVKVSGVDGTYTLSEITDNQEINGKNYETVLKGAVKNGTLTLETASKPGAMPFYIYGGYSGKKK